MNIRHMIATIQVYIHHVKGVEVDITPDLPRELGLFLQAYTIADTWVKANIIQSITI